MDNLHPLLLLNKTEQRLLRKLIRQIDDENKREQASNQLAKLSEAVLERGIGLKKYMVIKVEREDGFTLQLQALSLSFSVSHYTGYVDSWLISGRNIRKDGTLGQRDECLSFRSAHVLRRQLDGSWIALTLRKTK